MGESRYATNARQVLMSEAISLRAEQPTMRGENHMTAIVASRISAALNDSDGDDGKYMVTVEDGVSSSLMQVTFNHQCPQPQVECP